MALSMRVASIVLAAAIAGCASEGAVRTAPPIAELRPAVVGGALDPRLRGVWRDPGNSWIVDLRGEPVLYNESSVDCLRDGATGPQVLDYLATYWTGGGDRIGLTANPDIPLTHFERIESVPALCLKQPAATPTNTFNSLVASYSDHYPDFRVRGVDWDRNVAAARSRLRDDMSDAELFALLVSLLRPLQDSHVTLEDPKTPGRYFEEGQGKTLTRYYGDPASPGYPSWGKMRSAFMERWAASVETGLLAGKGAKAANGKLLYGYIAPSIAYLAATELYNTFEGENWRDDNVHYSRVLDEAFSRFAGARALIIDLSNNRGGSPTKARDIVSRVAPRYTIGGSIRPARPAGMEPQTWDVMPARNRPRFDGPVYVVVSDITVSSGEFAMMLLRELPNTLVIGERTRGSLSNLYNKRLPNGWIMEMPNQIILTPAGEDFAAVGIPPDVQLPVFGDGTSDPIEAHRAALQAVAARISQCIGRSRKTPCW